MRTPGRARILARAAAFALALAAMAGAVASRALATPVRVQLVREAGCWRLLRGGAPYTIKGAGGSASLEALAAAGANSVRTWGADSLGPLLDRADSLGLTVTVGFWLGHARHGFDYHDSAQVAAQYERVRRGLLAYKDHPAVLAWAIGNEMEGYEDGGDPAVWAAVQDLAALAHRLDPGHPTMTVTADIGGRRVASVDRLCPDIDIHGINSYGGAPSLPVRYPAAGGRKPYVVTEFGPPGTWEIGRNAWGAAEELTSTAKAAVYRRTYETLAADTAACLGTYAFTWGAKREATPTWFGMLLPDGARLGAVDELAEAWTGRAVAHPCPAIDSLALEGAGECGPGATLHARLALRETGGGALTAQWTLARDASQYETGGDNMPPPREYPDAIVRADLGGAELHMPRGAGRYRLYVTVRDGRGGAATANVPLLVRGHTDADAAEEVGLPFAVVGDELAPGYVPSGWMGDFQSLTMDVACTDQPHSGRTCVRFRYARLEGWTGVAWQHPANDWGDEPGGFDLTGASKLVFWARGAQGGETVRFGVGMIGNDKRFRDSAKAEREVVLAPVWTRYEIPLRGRSLTRIKIGFWWTLGGQGAPVTFDLDDVRFE